MKPITTPEALRTALDRGAGRDKVSKSDPSTAPLGTDEEAAGTPVPREAVATAAQNEIKGPVRPVTEGSEPFFPMRSALIGFVLLSALAILAVVYFKPHSPIFP
jgi:hypothetical protein